jgi:hypothetical protein
MSLRLSDKATAELASKGKRFLLLRPRLGQAGRDGTKSRRVNVVLPSERDRANALSLDAMVGRAGFEPATNGLKVRCSTN